MSCLILNINLSCGLTTGRGRDAHRNTTDNTLPKRSDTLLLALLGRHVYNKILMTAMLISLFYSSTRNTARCRMLEQVSGYRRRTARRSASRPRGKQRLTRSMINLGHRTELTTLGTVEAQWRKGRKNRLSSEFWT